MAKPAARLTDNHSCPFHGDSPISRGSQNVIINGLPAARVTDQCSCGPPDAIAMGSTGVLINGLAAARMGDPTAHGGSIIMGSPNVLIGEMGGGGGGFSASPAAPTMSAAKQLGLPFTKVNCGA